MEEMLRVALQYSAAFQPCSAAVEWSLASPQLIEHNNRRVEERVSGDENFPRSTRLGTRLVSLTKSDGLWQSLFQTSLILEGDIFKRTVNNRTPELVECTLSSTRRDQAMDSQNSKSIINLLLISCSRC